MGLWITPGVRKWPCKALILLVGGDLSGIQNYIFQIASIGEGGVAKRLRARSFYLSVLLEVVIHKILRKLDLPVSCNLVSAGGRFILLLPNTGTIKEELQRLSKEISGWFLEEFSGELALNLIWDVKLCGEDLGIREFSVPFNMLQSEMENKKLKRFEEILVCQAGWREEIFKRQKKYELYGKNVGDCHSCRKFPEALWKWYHQKTRTLKRITSWFRE